MACSHGTDTSGEVCHPVFPETSITIYLNVSWLTDYCSLSGEEGQKFICANCTLLQQCLVKSYQCLVKPQQNNKQAVRATNGSLVRFVLSEMI